LNCVGLAENWLDGTVFIHGTPAHPGATFILAMGKRLGTVKSTWD
jgi:hypothetical protein